VVPLFDRRDTRTDNDASSPSMISRSLVPADTLKRRPRLARCSAFAL
jgi:hypothetical protein